MAFHIPLVQILGKNHCGDSRQTAFKSRESFQDVLFRCYYAEKVVASFSHQIQSQYYGGNRSVSIEGVALGHFSAFLQTEINLSTKAFQRHAVFRSFLSDDIKQDSATTTAHIKSLIKLLKEQRLLTSTFSTIWENTEGCAEQ